MKRNLFLIILVIAVLFGCASQGTTGVQRVAADETTDLSGRWNDEYSRQVSQQMITDVLSRPWISNWVNDNDSKPTVIVGRVRNLSDEHIEMDTFVKDIERELINSGRVKFVASKMERKGVRDERMEQQTHASEDTVKNLGNETGADFMLIGGIKTIVDQAGGTRAKYYQIDMELVNIESNEKVWIGSKKIKKIINKKSTKW